MSKLAHSQCLTRSLSGPELAELISALGRGMDENGITGELLGVCLVEALERLKTQDGKTQDGREEGLAAGRPEHGLEQDAPATVTEDGRAESPLSAANFERSEILG
jgi:hypothetical protein